MKDCPKCGNYKNVIIEYTPETYICAKCGFEFQAQADDQQSRGDEEKKMANTNPWDEALDGNFIKLPKDEQKILVLTNWKIEENDKTFEGKTEKKWEFIATCVQEDGEDVEKTFATTSKPLLSKLRPFFENKEKTVKVKLSILKVGDGKNTQYSVKEK